MNAVPRPCQTISDVYQSCWPSDTSEIKKQCEACSLDEVCLVYECAAVTSRQAEHYAFQADNPEDRGLRALGASIGRDNCRNFLEGLCSKRPQDLALKMQNAMCISESLRLENSEETYNQLPLQMKIWGNIKRDANSLEMESLYRMLVWNFWNIDHTKLLLQHVWQAVIIGQEATKLYNELIAITRA